ncbi:hypothetical protein [Arthrobacter sp. NPDC057013]|uniref:hypothetical protein n=1 Tax=Arthrobacter sp. NPDC057013 TaxID=3345999 RepID=UPI003634446A
MDYTDPQQVPLAEAMPLHRGLWEKLVEQYDLVRTPFENIAGWDFGDFLFRSEFDLIDDQDPSSRVHRVS